MRLTPVLLVAQWSLEQMLWSRRTLAMVPLAGASVALALVYRMALTLDAARPSSGLGVFSALVAVVGLQLAAPLLALVYATGVVSDDEEAGTLTYFLTRPIRRSELLSGKILGSLALALFLFLPSLVLTYYIVLAPAGLSAVGRHFPILLRDLATAALGLAAYNGIFALAGTALRRPLLAGLLFVFGWQAVATVVPGALRYLTVSHYLHALLPAASATGALSSLLGERSSAPAAAAVLLLVTAASHAAAVWFFRRKEV